MASLSSPLAYLPAVNIRNPSRRHVRIRAAAPAVQARAKETLYGVLGLRLEATGQEVKAAYRARARTCHPDSAAGSADPGEFMRVHAAYSTLSDPAKRAEYDRGLLFSAVSAAPKYFSRRTWETDQCW